jgi:hypothetical protein
MRGGQRVAHMRVALMMVRRPVAFHVTVCLPPSVVIRLMVCIGVQMLKGRGHRAHLHREAHEQDED